MDKSDVSFWLSVAGFATSTVLAVIKLVEFRGSRRVSFKADVRLNSLPDVGNEIILLNRANIPVTISYFDLAWVDRRSIFGWTIPFVKKVVREDSPLDPSNGCDVTVAPHGTHSLYFNDQDHFEWGVWLTQHIYLRLWLVGDRSPRWIWITGPR